MLYSSWSWWSWYGRPWLLKPAMRTRWGLSAPCACSFFSATARMCARADGGAWPIRASAALAWLLSGIGNDRPGPAKVDAGRARRFAAVSLAIVQRTLLRARQRSRVMVVVHVRAVVPPTLPGEGAGSSIVERPHGWPHCVRVTAGGMVVVVDASSVRLLGASPGRE